MKKHKSMIIITVMAVLAILLMGANKKLSEMDLLGSLSLGSSDRFYIADVSEGVSKAILASELRAYAQRGFTPTNRVAIVNSTGELESGEITTTELALLDGLTAELVTVSGTQIVLDKDLMGGTINNCSIGAATPNTGEFTTLEASTSVLSPKVTTDWQVCGSLETGKLHTKIYTTYAVADGTTSQLDIALSALPEGSRLIGCQIRIDVALGTTWGASYAGGAGNQKICETGESGTANTKISTMFDYSSDSGILSGVGSAFKIAVSGAGTIANGGRVSVFIWYDYFEDVQNYQGSGT